MKIVLMILFYISLCLSLTLWPGNIAKMYNRVNISDTNMWVAGASLTTVIAIILWQCNILF